MQLLNRIVWERVHAGQASFDEALAWQDRSTDRIRPLDPGTAVTEPADVDTSTAPAWGSLEAADGLDPPPSPLDPSAALTVAPQAPPAPAGVAA